MLKKILEQWKNREWTEEDEKRLKEIYDNMPDDDAYKLPEGFELVFPKKEEDE